MVYEAMQTYQDPHAGKPVDFRPIIGVYTCLLCERSFSTKTKLKRHYCRGHRESIPDYEGTDIHTVDRAALEFHVHGEPN